MQHFHFKFKELRADEEGRIFNTNFFGKGIEQEIPQFEYGRTKTKYLSVSYKGKTYAAHRIVWECFNGKIPEGMEVCHKNGIGTDNKIENLELGTHKYNMQSAKKGIPKFARKVVVFDTETKQRHYCETLKEASEITGISTQTISYNLRNKNVNKRNERTKRYIITEH